VNSASENVVCFIVALQESKTVLCQFGHQSDSVGD